MPYNAPASASAPQWDIEEFGKETILDAEVRVVSAPLKCENWRTLSFYDFLHINV